MADLTITITEEMSGMGYILDISTDSVSDTQTKVIAGVTNILHYQGECKLFGDGNPIFKRNANYNTGTAGDQRDVCYIRVTNKEGGSNILDLVIGDEGSTLTYFSLKSEESFILFPVTGDTNAGDLIKSTASGTGTIKPTKYIDSIYFNNSGHVGKHYEIFVAWIAGNN